MPKVRPPVAHRRRLSGEERRASIVAAATEVFSELGYQRGTMAEVARRVGVSEPVVFQNFGSKAAVFAAVLDGAGGRVSGAMRARAAAAGSVAAWLTELLGPEHLRHVHAPGTLGALFHDATSLAGDPRVADAARRAHRMVAGTVAELLAEGQREGSVRPDLDPETGAWWLLSLLASQGFRTAAVPDPDRLEAGVGAMTLRMLVVD
jgi:AcrR family transcriptional regulator